MRYQFTVEVEGKCYECEREVTGQRVLRQQIRVNGVGSINDSASYAKKRSHTMESVARIIAREIIDKISIQEKA